MQDRIAEIEELLDSLPKGTLVYKNIKGKKQPYLQWTENGKSISKYIKTQERELIFRQLDLKGQLKKELQFLYNGSLRHSLEKGTDYIRFQKEESSSVSGKPKTVFDFLRNTASLYPKKTAFSDINESITYHELLEKSCHIAQELLKNGIRKMPVAVYLERSVQCLPCFYGTVLSGNFFCVIDVCLPPSRASRTFDLLSPKVILTDPEHLEAARALSNGQKVINIAEAFSNCPDQAAIYKNEQSILSTDIMFVVFTSGSDGIPKAAVIPHRSVVRQAEVLTERFGIDQKTIFGNQTPFYFIMSILELFGGVLAGATTYIIPSKYFVFPGLLVKYIADHKMNFLNWVASALTMVSSVNAFEADDISCVKTVAFGGEVMPVKALNKWKEALPDCRFLNVYGTTEVCGICSYYEVNREFTENEKLPIGLPLANAEFIIMDETGMTVSLNCIGELSQDLSHFTGELYVRSDALSCGYFHSSTQTSNAFVQNPLNPYYPETVYKTGDIVKINAVGEPEYIGRKDRQISYMGWRIELGDIENVISGIDGIKENCCYYDDMKKQIILVYSGDVDEDDVNKEIRKLLPDYMQPRKRIHLEQLPHNESGKIDRKALSLTHLSQSREL